MVPRKWDIVKLQIEPHVGYEIGGHDQLTKKKLQQMSAMDLINYYSNERRPVVVLSNHYFNQAGVLECMPIMSYNHLPKRFSQQMIPLKNHTKNHKIHGYVVPLQVLGYDYIHRQGVILDKVDKTISHQINVVFHDIFADEK